MSAPLIGVTTSVTVGASPERAYVNVSYLRAVQSAGGVPVPLPPHLDTAARQALWPRLDGILLTGGADIDPARFGETPHPKTYDVSAERDDLEFELVGRAVLDEVPLFAICRGVQVLNVALGGSLWQHIPDQFGERINHSQTEPRTDATHAVSVTGETLLSEILRGGPGARSGAGIDIRTNSMHHQALNKLGTGLREVAWAEDGVIEAVELPDAPIPIFGVQWHPEELAAHDPAAANLFRALVDAASRRAAAR